MITSISNGTIINDNSKLNIISLPGNLNLENAKAPKIVVKPVRQTEHVVTITELTKYTLEEGEEEGIVT